MAIRMNLHGLEVEVDAADLGETLRQLQAAGLLPAALAPKRSVAPPAPQVQLFTPYPPQPAPAHAPKPDLVLVKEEGPAAHFGLTLLKNLRDTRVSGGLTPSDVQRIVGAGHPKGIGSRMVKINETLRAGGFELRDVYTNDRGPLGDRVWRAGPKIDQAISLLEASAITGGVL